MKDYADDAVIMGKDGPIEGKAAIRAFFLSLDEHMPSATFTTKVVETHGDVAIEDWVMNAGSPNGLKGRDVFIIRKGKICFQFTVRVEPVLPAPQPAAMK